MSRRSDFGGGGSSVGSSVGGRRSKLDREVDDKLAKLRLQLLEEKLQDEQRKLAKHKYRQVTGREVDKGEAGATQAELEVARLRHAELRSRLDREQRLAEKLAEKAAERQRPPTQERSSRRGETPRDKRGDRLADMMEMMMMQNSQVHNMILNQMLLKQASQRSDGQQQQQQPQPPMPVYIPMPMFPPYQQQQHQQQIPEPRSPARRSPVLKTPKSQERPPTKVKQTHIPFPFPGNDSQQKLRRLAYAAFFLASLNRLTNENKFRPTNDFLFDLKLKEILETLHRIYKAPDGQLYSITLSTMMGDDADELSELMNSPKTLNREEERSVTQELSYCVENTVFQITDIMPSTGILGTHRKSGVFEMLRSGNLYPKGYFYDMEKEMLEFSEDGRTGRISDADGRMLIIGMFLVRALIETLYLKTEHYGMVLETTPKAERNIKLVSTIMMYLYRKIVGQLAAIDQGTKKSKVSIPELPPELRDVMHSDQEIKPVLKLIKKSFDYAENLLMQWSDEYVRRLRESAF